LVTLPPGPFALNDNVSFAPVSPEFGGIATWNENLTGFLAETQRGFMGSTGTWGVPVNEAAFTLHVVELVVVPVMFTKPEGLTT
jgi:hypothetical protein